nr:ribonuclease H-like domain-containing protein [Tanacetum cinerariifolium]
MAKDVMFLVSRWWDFEDRRNLLLFEVKKPRKDVIFDDIVLRSFNWCVARVGDDIPKKWVSSSSFDLNLTFGDPLYLHPNDTGGSSIVTIKLTDTENYKAYSIAMTFDLRNHNKIGFIDIKAAFAIVSGEESHRNITSVRATKPTATAFAAKGPNPNLKCTNCDKIGHTVNRCFELVGYPAGYVKINLNPTSRSVSSNNTSADVHSNGMSSNNATTNNSSVSLSNEQLTRLVNLLNDNGVSTPNGNLTEYSVSLLSVHKLLRDSKLFVGFDESNCYIQDLKANKTVRIGKQFNDLYLFDVDNAYKIVSNKCIAFCYVSTTLWHHRLGHPVDQVLDALKTTLNLDSHPTSNHPYVWGPYKVTSRDGFRYFLTIVDDFYKAVWVYMLKGKDDVYDFIGIDDSEATSMDENNNTHLEGTVPNEIDFVNNFYEYSEFNSEVEEYPVNTVRSKSVEPTCYEEVILDNNWIDVMNAEIEALNKNHTWEIIELPANRKAIEYGLLRCKPVSTPMESNSVLPYIATKDDPLLDNITGKKQNALSKSSIEAEYRSMSSAACEIIWIQKLLFDLKTKVTLPVDLFSDNKSALQLAINLVFMKCLKILRLMSTLSERKLQKGS